MGDSAEVRQDGDTFHAVVESDDMAANSDRQRPRCYICGKGEGEPPTSRGSSRIVRPCCCEGDLKFVHQACLQRKRLESSPWSPYFWDCEVCGASYRMKYQRHWLRVLTSLPALLTVCTLNAVASLLLSAEFFKRAMPTVLRWIGELDEDTPSAIHLELFNYDLGYWAGGLLNITFLHKMVDRNWTGLIQFLPLFQISIRSTNDEKLSDLRVGVWYFLCLYSCYAAGRFFSNSFVFIHVMLRKFVGEEVLDFVSGQARRSESSASLDADCEFPFGDEATCLCCMDLAAHYEMDKCGHLTCCGMCRPRLIYHKLKRHGTSATLPPMRLLGRDHLDATTINCPICRTEGRLVKRSVQARPKAE